MKTIRHIPLVQGVTIHARSSLRYFWERMASADRRIEVEGPRADMIKAGFITREPHIPRGVTTSTNADLGKLSKLADGRIRVRTTVIEVVRRNVAFQAVLDRAVSGKPCSNFFLPPAPRRNRSDHGDAEGAPS